ncbi:MAG: hypothetical protein Q8L27_04185 [archaeon]|nr:hypothetical protein [archaeon]
MHPKKKLISLAITLGVLFILVLASVYVLYMNLRTCTNEECFNSALIKCSKAYYQKDSVNTIMEYRINGRIGNSCVVNVKLLQVREGSVELTALQEQEMVCSLPLNVVSIPEGNLEQCHGLLKEEIQNLVIKRMHAQIIENLGKINEETTKIL